MAEVFQHLLASQNNEDGANITISSSSEEGSRRNSLEGKDIPDYVKRHQALDREERAAWRNLQMAKIQADAEKEKMRSRNPD